MLDVFLRELRRLATTPVYWLTLVVAPLFCALLFTSLMRSGLPADLPIGLVDMDGSATTRNLARNLDAFQNCHIAERYASPTEARAAMQRGDIYAFYTLDKGFGRKLMSSQQPDYSFYVNEAYIVAGSLTYKELIYMSNLGIAFVQKKMLELKHKRN